METPIKSFIVSDLEATPRRSTRKSIKIINEVILSASTKRKKRRTRKDTIFAPKLEFGGEEEPSTPEETSNKRRSEPKTVVDQGSSAEGKGVKKRKSKKKKKNSKCLSVESPEASTSSNTTPLTFERENPSGVSKKRKSKKKSLEKRKNSNILSDGIPTTRDEAQLSKSGTPKSEDLSNSEETKKRKSNKKNRKQSGGSPSVPKKAESLSHDSIPTSDNTSPCVDYDSGNGVSMFVSSPEEDIPNLENTPSEEQDVNLVESLGLAMLVKTPQATDSTRRKSRRTILEKVIPKIKLNDITLNTSLGFSKLEINENLEQNLGRRETMVLTHELPARETGIPTMEVTEPQLKSSLTDDSKKNPVFIFGVQKSLLKQSTIADIQDENIATDSLDEFLLNEVQVSTNNVTVRRRKTPSKVKVPNFKQIHIKAYKKMESVVENFERVRARAMELALAKPLSSLKKISPKADNSKAQKKMEFPLPTPQKKFHLPTPQKKKDLQISTPQKKVHLPTPQKKLPQKKKELQIQTPQKKFHLPTPQKKKELQIQTPQKKFHLPTPQKKKEPKFDSKTKLSTLKKTGVSGPSKIPVNIERAKTPVKFERVKTPLKPLGNMTNIKAKIDSNLKLKLSENIQPKDIKRFQELYKGRTSISLNKGSSFLKGVRLNKRFELQLRLRGETK
ncbi:hypothetical protein ACFFRR_001687 [Megaselia abdita]